MALCWKGGGGGGIFLLLLFYFILFYFIIIIIFFFFLRNGQHWRKCGILNSFFDWFGVIPKILDSHMHLSSLVVLVSTYNVSWPYLTTIPRARVGYEMIDSQRGTQRQPGYNQLVSNKREWNNCFIRNSHGKIFLIWSYFLSPLTLTLAQFMGHGVMALIPWPLNLMSCFFFNKYTYFWFFVLTGLAGKQSTINCVELVLYFLSPRLPCYLLKVTLLVNWKERYSQSRAFC